MAVGLEPKLEQEGKIGAKGGLVRICTENWGRRMERLCSMDTGRKKEGKDQSKRRR